MANLLVIEPDQSLRDRMVEHFMNRGFLIEQAPTYSEARSFLEQSMFDVVISSSNLQDCNICELFEEDSPVSANTMVIVTAENKNLNAAVNAIRKGAFDLVRHPLCLNELQIKVGQALEVKRLKNELQNLRGERNIIYHPKNFIGESRNIRRVFRIVEKVAQSNSSVLLTGETGTGKELVAGAIHYNSFRRDNPFVKVNCAALPDQLLESELFGHEKGAFTGADKRRIGRFEQADGGTIFLDEIGDMSLTTQAKLLRVLQEKEFQRVGGNQTIKVDTRIITATNKDLYHEIEQRRFRQDLLYRLNVVTIEIPPLRERKGDILLLTYFFLKKISGELKKKNKELHPLAIRALVEYSWPGNIRELENTIERAVLMSEEDTIYLEDLNLPQQQNSVEWDVDAIRIPATGIHLEEVERKVILQALKMCDWVQKDAARFLGISQRVLNYKIKRFNITHPRWRKHH
jgi:DNA-binding NtrC family response regulator